MKPEVKPKVAAVPGNASPATLKKTCDTCRKRKVNVMILQSSKLPLQYIDRASVSLDEMCRYEKPNWQRALHMRQLLSSQTFVHI